MVKKLIMKKSQKQQREERRAKKWYGVKKLRKGEKVCWMAQEYKNGWALGLALGTRTLWLRNLRIPSRQEVERVMESSVVFINLKNNNESD